MEKKTQENKEQEYNITLTKEEVIDRIRDIDNNENFLIWGKVNNGIKLANERNQLIELMIKKKQKEIEEQINKDNLVL